MIARELLWRKRCEAIVAAGPPPVLEQWKGELDERFGLVFYPTHAEPMGEWVGPMSPGSLLILDEAHHAAARAAGAMGSRRN